MINITYYDLQWVFGTVPGFIITLITFIFLIIFVDLCKKIEYKEMIFHIIVFIIFLIITAFINKFFPKLDILGQNKLIYGITTALIGEIICYILSEKFYE